MKRLIMFFSIASLITGCFTFIEANNSAKGNSHPMQIYQMDGVTPKDVEKIMSMTDEQIVAALPVQTPRIHTGCPNCHAHKKELTWMDYGERGQLRHIWYWDYDPLKPNQISCMLCKEVYPNNPKFPETHIEEIKNPSGEVFKIKSYFVKGEPDSPYGSQQRDKKYYMDGALDTARWYWLRDQMRNLARLYHLTKDEKYAEKALVIFNGYCDRFPSFVMCSGYGRNYSSWKGRRKRNTRAHRRASGDGDWRHMWPVYDLLYNSEAMKNSKAKYGQDLREKYIKNVVNYCNDTGKPLSPEVIAENRKKKLAEPIKGGQQSAPHPDKWDIINNDTEMLRRVIKTWEQFPFQTFAVDGGYYEGLGYGSIQLMATVGFRNMNGYSDPEDYTPPPGEKKYKNFQYPTGEYEKFYQRALEIHEALRLPNGQKVMFNDGSGSTSATFIKRDPLKRAISINRPGIEHIILADGEGEDMVQAHIGFGNATWHSHTDTLGLQLWGQGHYLLDDITYPKHRQRANYSSNRYHNTVVIDGRGQATNMGDGDVVLYEPNLPGFQVVKVDAPRAHVGLADIYSRQLMLVTTDPKHPYVIDVFRIKGGKVKDYMLLSATKHKTKASYSLPLEKMEGKAPLIDFSKRYEAFNHMSKGDGSKDFTVTYEIQDPKPYPKSIGNGKVGTKHYFVGDKNTTVFKTQIPSNNALFKGGYKELHEFPDQWPFTIVRHEGEETVFAVVHEPFKEKPVIKSVKRMKSPNETLALQIDLPNRTDKLLMSLSDEPVKAACAGMVLDGKVGFVAQAKDGKADAYLIGGTSFTDKASKTNLTQKIGEFSGKIVKSTRLWDGGAFDGFLLEGDNLPPAGDELAGSWIQLENRGKMSVVPSRRHCFRAPFREGTTREKAMEQALAPGDKRNPNKNIEEAKKRVEFFFDRSGIETTVEIAKVIKKDGQTWLLTKRDHGIRIDGKKKFAGEVFMPGREVSGKDTTFSIVRGISNQAKPVVKPAGGAFMGAIKVTMTTPAPKGKIEYAFVKDGSKPHWQVYINPLNIKKDGQLRVRGIAYDGIKKPLADSYEFSFAKSAATVDAGKLKPGLIAETKILHVAGEIPPELKGKEKEVMQADQKVQSGVKKPDFDLPGKNDYQYFDNLYVKFHVLEYYDGEYTANVEVQPQGSIKDLIEKYHANGTYYGRKVFSGYIKVPESGIYTFYFRRNQDGYLKIDDKLLLDYHGYIGEPIAQQVKVPLTKGLHPIEFCVQLKPSRVPGWSKEFELSWSGPGLKRRDMNESDYLYDPAKLATLEKQVKPLQKRNKRPAVEYAGQPLFVSHEEAARLYKVRDLGSKSK